MFADNRELHSRLLKFKLACEVVARQAGPSGFKAHPTFRHYAAFKNLCVNLMNGDYSLLNDATGFMTADFRD
jgi:hypothetical protein